MSWSGGMVKDVLGPKSQMSLWETLRDKVVDKSTEKSSRRRDFYRSAKIVSIRE